MPAINHYKIASENISKTWSLMILFFVLLIGIGWFLSTYYGSSQILYIFVAISIFMNFFSYWFSDKVILKISGAKLAKKEEYYDLYTMVENLSIASGLPMPKVYVIDDSSPNAFATGRNPKHGVVAFTTGLLSILDKSELEGVIAHELAHIKNRDILLQSVVVVLVGLISLAADFFLRITMFSDNREGKGGGIMLIIGIALLILSPIIAAVIQLAISRKREFLADSTGALITRYPQGLASALRKISSSPIELKRSSHATAHLFISDPYKTDVKKKNKHKKTSFYSRIFSTHPPVEERVLALIGEEAPWVN